MSNLPAIDTTLAVIRIASHKELQKLQTVINIGLPENEWQLPADINEYWQRRGELSVNKDIVIKGENIAIFPQQCVKRSYGKFTRATWELRKVGKEQGMLYFDQGLVHTSQMM